MTNPEAQAITVARMKDQIDRMEKHLEANDAEILALQEERNKAMRYGIGLLGAALLGLASVIANFVGSHLK